MGIWNLMFGGADGIREAMMQAYQRHYDGRRQGKGAGGDSPHAAGLYGALATRYTASRKPMPEVAIWAELTPFLLMPKEMAPKALAEYIVYQSKPDKADVLWLTEVVAQALKKLTAPKSLDDDLRGYLASTVAALEMEAPWSQLLKPDIIRKIRSLVTK